MTEEITNDIDKLDGMVKIKGKCGYEFIGGCSELRRLKQENEELKAENERINRCMVEALHHEGEALRNSIKYKTCLQEIKEIAEK